MQQLHCNLRIENQSMSDVEGYRIEITQYTTYTARRPQLKTRSESENVFKLKCYDDICLKYTTRIFENNIQIPALPPSTEADDDMIINIKYELNVTAYISGCSLNSEITMPLHIGTKALSESLQADREAGIVDLSPSAPILPSTSGGGDNPPEYQTLSTLQLYRKVLYKFHVS